MTTDEQTYLEWQSDQDRRAREYAEAPDAAEVIAWGGNPQCMGWSDTPELDGQGRPLLPTLDGLIAAGVR